MPRTPQRHLAAQVRGTVQQVRQRGSPPVSSIHCSDCLSTCALSTWANHKVPPHAHCIQERQDFTRLIRARCRKPASRCHQGNRIREDVREAAQYAWSQLCYVTVSVLGDNCEAAEVLETCVSRVSRHLDGRGEQSFSQRTRALLWMAIRREVYLRANKRNRWVVLDRAQEFERY